MSSASSPGPRGMTIEDRSRWIALYVLCAGVLMIVLDVTIVNVALPSIQDEAGGLEHLEVLRDGRAADRHVGRERADRGGPVGQALEDRAARRVPQGGHGIGKCVSHRLP